MTYLKAILISIISGGAVLGILRLEEVILGPAYLDYIGNYSFDSNLFIILSFIWICISMWAVIKAWLYTSGQDNKKWKNKISRKNMTSEFEEVYRTIKRNYTRELSILRLKSIIFLMRSSLNNTIVSTHVLSSNK